MPDLQLRRSSDHPGSPEQAALRALIIDDDENYLISIRAVAERFGFRLTTAPDGREAMARLRGGVHFDLLVVDCGMPRMNGLEFIAQARAEESYRDVYAVMLTAREDVETKITALRAGYDDFLCKSAGDLEISAKFSAARRLVVRQHRLDVVVRELYGLATRDDLTGVYNRRFFFGEARRALAQGEAVSLVLFDLDDFKMINDTHGHLAGDRILRDVGALYISHTRHQDLIARYGGDEFMMLVSDLAPAQVEALAERLAGDLAALRWTFGEKSVAVSVTIGFSCSTLLASPTLVQLLSAADRDLYKNKWVRKYPGQDPSLYEYDQGRDANVLEFVTQITDPTRRNG